MTKGMVPLNKREDHPRSNTKTETESGAEEGPGTVTIVTVPTNHQPADTDLHSLPVISRERSFVSLLIIQTQENLNVYVKDSK